MSVKHCRQLSLVPFWRQLIRIAANTVFVNMAENKTPTKTLHDGQRTKRCRSADSPLSAKQSLPNKKTVFRPILPKSSSESCEGILPLPNEGSRKLPDSLTMQEMANHVINKIGTRNQKLQDNTVLPVSKKERESIKNVLDSGTADNIAKVIMAVKPIRSAILKLHLETLKEQSVGLCKKGIQSSVLRAGSKCYDNIRNFNWNDIIEELLQRAPDILDVLATIAVPKPIKKERDAESIVPPFCLALSVLMNIHNAELSLVQKVMTCLLGVGGCNKLTMKRLNSLRICQSHQNWLRILDDTGTHLADMVGEQLDKGLKPRLVFDNFDFKVSPGEMLKGTSNIDRHWLCQYVTFDRIDTTELDNSVPQGDLKQLELNTFLLTAEEQEKMRQEYIVLVARILTSFIPWLKDLSKLLPRHIQHSFSSEMKEKSVIISLPVKPYNQKKHSDVIQYLEEVQKFTKEAMGGGKNIVQIPLGGDLLGRERVTGAKKLRKGCDEAEERFDNITEVSEYWHAKQSLLSLCWKHLYSTKSAREPGTLFYFRNLHGRTNVKPKVENNYAAAEGLLTHLTTAYIICAFMHFAGMDEAKSKPTKIKSLEPNMEYDKYLAEVIGQFVDTFCLFEPISDKLQRMQSDEEEPPQNENEGLYQIL